MIQSHAWLIAVFVRLARVRFLFSPSHVRLFYALVGVCGHSCLPVKTRMHGHTLVATTYHSRTRHLDHRAVRPILYSCSWPAYQVDEGTQPDYKSIAHSCNLWRNYDDIMDSWQSVLSIIDFYAKNQEVFSAINGK